MKVRRDAGDAARIVAANRVRRGGIGGFFAKEHFEVLVDLEPHPGGDAFVAASESDDRAALAARSVLDLVEATNEEERAYQLVDLTTEAGHASMPTVSTQTEAFQDVLARLSTEVAEPVDAPPAPPARPAPEPREPLLRELAGEPFKPEISEPAAVVIDVAPAPVVPAPVPARHPERKRTKPQIIERPENALARLGLPPRHIPRGVTSSRLRAELIESLANLPTVDVLPDAPGVAIAVVGVGARAVRLARTLAEEQGLDPDNVVIAAPGSLGDRVPSWLQITDPPTADERRRSWRRRADATFVAVAMTPDGDGADWAASMLDALEPTQVWAITHAAWKPEDIDAWCDQLGGVDVLALERLGDTVSPAAVLGLGMPIGRLDGAPATAMRWAELLLERLTVR